MPELPEVETVCRTLRRHVLGQRVTALRVPQPALRWAVDVPGLSQRLVGAQIVAVRRRAKYILIDLASGDGVATPYVLAIHLGMSGIVRVVRSEVAPRLHDHAVFELGSGLQLRFNDPRRFGSIFGFEAAAQALHPRFRHLGVEPVGETPLAGAHLYASSRGVTRSIKVWLMDAAVVVGVGNIYASEALHRAGISPKRRAGALTRPKAAALAAAVVQTLQDAIELGGTTLRDFSDADAQTGHFGQALRVYGRDGAACGTCGGIIRKIVQGGRSTYYCSHCQRL